MASISLDVVAPDGSSAVITHLDVVGDRATVVLVVVTADAVWAAVEAMAGAAARGIDGPLAVYDQEGTASATWTRRGFPGAVEGGEVVAAGLADRLEGGEGTGRGAIGIEASLSSVLVSRATDCIGTVRAEVRLPTGPMVVEGLGRLRETSDDEARVESDLSLRGQHLCAGGADGAGWVWRGGSSQDAVVILDPPSDDRGVRFELADGTIVEGRVAIRRPWTFERSSGQMQGALVVGVVGGAAVAGITADRSG